MKSLKKTSAMALALGAVSSAAVAEVQSERLEEVLVSASRTNKPINAIPNTVKVIDRQALENQLATSTSLLDGLSFAVPSLTPAHQKMSSNGVTLRGRTPLYMFDGVPQSTPLRNGERSGYTLDPAFIERVEVIYGANAIQGVGSTGGIINYVTVAAPDNGEALRKVSAKLTSDDFESNGLHYKLAGVLGKRFERSDVVLGLAYDVQDLYHDGSGNAIAIDSIQGDTMNSTSRNVFVKWGLDVDEYQRLELAGSYFKLKGDGDYRLVSGDRLAGRPATSEKGREAGDPTENIARNLSANYSHDEFYGGQLTLQGFYYDFYALYGGGTFPAYQDDSLAPNGTLFDQSALNSEKYGSKLTWVRANTFWQGLELALGLDYLRDETFQDLAQTGRIWVPKMIYQGWAPFVQLDQALLDDRLHLSLGARFENVELDVPSFTTIAGANNTFVEGGKPTFDELLGNVGLVFDVNDELSVFASYAEGYTMPDAGLILRGVNTAGQSIDSLIDLQPVVADNLEVGANFQRGGFDLALSYFWSDSDLGSRILVVGGVGQITRQKTEIEGLEISASYHFDSGVVAGLGYSQLEGRFDSDGDGKVDKDLDGRNIAPDRVNLYLDAPLAENWTGRLQLSRLLDRDFDGGQPEHDFEGYDLVDAVVTYQAEDLGKFTLGVENLLDEQYITYYSQTLTYVNDDTYFAGRGRAISLAWEKSF